MAKKDFIPDWASNLDKRKDVLKRNLQETADYEHHICDLKSQIAQDEKRLATLRLERELVKLDNGF